MAGKEYDVATVSKVIKILEYIKEKDGAYFTQIYTDLGLPKSTTYQILSTLNKHHFVSKSEDGKFDLGIKLFELGFAMSAKLNIRKISNKILRDLTEKTGLTAHLSILNEELQGIYIEKIDGAKYLTNMTAIGQKVYMHCSATGKALLAWQSEEVKNQILKNLDYVKFTDNTITDEKALQKELVLTKKRGFSIENRERENIICSVGAPIFDRSGKVVAAISLGAIVLEFTDEDINLYAGLVKEACRQISEQLGIEHRL